MLGRFATAKPYRIKAAHRRRRKVAWGLIVQRYYDPAIGRFLSVDPVTANSGTGANFNRYWYANNNPYKFIDPDGRQAKGYQNNACGVTGCDAGSFGNEREATAQDHADAAWQQVFNGNLSGAFSSGMKFVSASWQEAFSSPESSLLTAMSVIPAVGVEASMARNGLQRGVSVLGHYPGYVRTAESIGARYFNVPAKIWDRMSPAQQWKANSRFLDRLAARGDSIVLSTPASQARAGSWYARELEYMASKGYTLNPKGTQMLPPPR